MYRDEHPVNLKFEARRTAGGGVDSVLSSFGGAATSFTASDSDGAGAGSDDVASVVSAALASFGTSASYRVLPRTAEK